jgi:hypothetical protein
VSNTAKSKGEKKDYLLLRSRRYLHFIDTAVVRCEVSAAVVLRIHIPYSGLLAE